jgi:hypothetical protein
MGLGQGRIELGLAGSGPDTCRDGGVPHGAVGLLSGQSPQRLAHGGLQACGA